MDGPHDSKIILLSNSSRIDPQSNRAFRHITRYLTLRSDDDSSVCMIYVPTVECESPLVPIEGLCPAVVGILVGMMMYRVKALELHKHTFCCPG